MRIYRLNNLDLGNLLKEKLNYKQAYIDSHIWKYDYLITKILFQKILLPYKRHYTFSQTYLKDRLGSIKRNGQSHKAHLLIRNDLKKLGVIDFKITGTSDFGAKSFKRQVFYKINDEFLMGGWSEVKYDMKSIEPIFKEKQEYLGIYAALRDNLSKVTIDYDSAVNHLNSLELE
jgi:hypothetical protein